MQSLASSQRQLGAVSAEQLLQFFLLRRRHASAILLRQRCRRQVLGNVGAFLILFLTYFVRTLLKDGYAYDPLTGTIAMEPYKYLHNLLTMWPLLVLFVIGVGLLLYGVIRTVCSKVYVKGIWPAGIGVVLVVLVLLLITGWNNTAYYPSNADLQSSLTIVNSSSSKFTLTVMFYVSLLVPVVLAYIWYAWRQIDRHKLTRQEIKEDEAY